MKLLFDVGHPAQVHFHRNVTKILENRGHEILFSSRNKDVLLYLLKKYDKNNVQISEQKSTFLGLSKELVQRCYGLYKIVRGFMPDLICGPGETVAIVGRLAKKPTIIFNDSEPVFVNKFLTYPWTNTICTPTTFTKDLGKKHVKYNGYKELAYLHPNYFKPDKNIYTYLNLNEGEKFVLMRFVAWKASHDVGKRGLSLKDKIKLVSELEKYARVFITSESPIPSELEKYKITFPPEKIHDALYFADLLIGDSQTMTTEAGVLGTPAIRCNSFVGENDMGNFIELEQKYGLIFNYNDSDKAIEKAIELIQKSDLKEEWQNKKEALLKDKIDVTAFMVWFVENYPDSFKEMKEYPEIQYKFK